MSANPGDPGGTVKFRYVAGKASPVNGKYCDVLVVIVALFSPTVIDPLLGSVASRSRRSCRARRHPENRPTELHIAETLST
jgi:hypothetical protein